MKKNYPPLCKIMYSILFSIVFTNLCFSQSPPNETCETVLNFDGIDDLVTAAMPTSNTSPFTIEGWFKANSTTGNSTLFYNGTPSSNGYGLFLDNEEINILFGGITQSYTNYDIVIGQWTHFAITYDGWDLRFYINGVGSYQTVYSTVNIPTGNFHIGGNASNNTDYFNGSMDEIRYWNYERSIAEIQATVSAQLVGNETGLLSYYNFNETSGSLLPDLTANGNDGTLMNMDNADWTLVDGSDPSLCMASSLSPPNAVCETVLNFDGINDLVTTPIPTTSTTNFTIEGWFKANSTSGYSSLLYNGTSASNGYGLFLDNDEINILYGGVVLKYTGHEIITGQWTHFAITHNGFNLKFYINGVVSYQTAPASVNAPTGDFHIGGNASNNSDFFDGSIDEVRIWNSERNITEIQATMNTQLVGNESGLLSYYNFNQTTGTVLPDLTTNSNDGTLMNMDNTDWALPDGSDPSSCMTPLLSPPNDTCDTVLNFDGVNDLVTTPIPTTDTQNFTIEGWFKANSTTGYATLFYNGTSSANGYGLFLDNNKISILYGGVVLNYTNNNISIGEWTHFAIAKSGAIIKFYINGVGAYQNTSSTINTPTGNFHIGGNAANNADFFDGSIDEVRFWNYERSEVEIQAAIDLQLVGNESGLLSYHNFNETTGAVLTDLTTNGNDGTLVNMDNTDWTLADGSQNCTVLNTASFNTISISIYPNPTQNSFIINGLNEVSTVELFNINGGLIFKQKNYQGNPINIANLTKGVYLMKVNNSNGVFHEKIVKN